MFPNTLVSLALFVALLAPGFVYLQRRERYHPGIDYTTLRETSLVVLASIATIGIVVAVLGLLRLVPFRLVPDAWVPDVGAYADGGEAYVRANYLEAVLWLVIIVGTACLIAAVAAIPPARLLREKLTQPAVEPPPRTRTERWNEWVTRRRGPGPIDQQSGWGQAFNIHPKAYKSVLIELVDGSAIHGHMLSKSPQLEENGDRDIVVAKPLKIRPGADADWKRVDDHVAVVSASKISYFLVTFSQDPLT